MSKVIKNPRNGCALHGALQTVQEINGAVPVVHANAGCGVVNYLANQNASGGNGNYSGFQIPGTAAQERHVIFGGASRLREQIKNTIKVVKGDLYVILNSCESAMVGDDVDAMTREIVEQGEPVVDTLVAGFNGGSHYGYEQVLADIFKSIDEVKKSEVEKNPKLVNIFGIVPQKDPYWQGNLEEISRILNSVGLEANVFFGTEGGVQDLVQAKNAALSIVFSKWGEVPAQVLNERHDVPYIVRPSLPLGAKGIEDLLQAIGEKLTLEADRVQSFLDKEKAYEKNLLYRVRDYIIEQDLSRDAVIVGDEEQVNRLSEFLTNTLGVEVPATVITDDIKGATDQKEIDDIIRSSRAQVIFGSSLEKNISNQLGIPLIQISYPIFDKLILNEANIGTKGEISFIEEYVTVVKEFEAANKKDLLAFVKGVQGGESWRELSQKTNYSKKLSLVTELPTREYISAQR